MPTTLIIPEKKPERRAPPVSNYLILDLDDREIPEGYKPKDFSKEERGVCIIGEEDEGLDLFNDQIGT